MYADVYGYAYSLPDSQMLSMKTAIDKKGRIVSWIVELVIGVVSGVVSGIILARLVPDGSVALEPTESVGGTVTQQVMAANGDVITVAGDGNYAHIGDDNSVHVNSPAIVSGGERLAMGTFGCTWGLALLPSLSSRFSS